MRLVTVYVSIIIVEHNYSVAVALGTDRAHESEEEMYLQDKDGTRHHHIYLDDDNNGHGKTGMSRSYAQPSMANPYLPQTKCLAFLTTPIMHL